jgi:hypothetical protein
LRRFQTWFGSANLVDDRAEDEGEALRYAGYRRSRELLELHQAKVERLAQALAERTELNQFEIGQILMSDDPGLCGSPKRN